MKNTEKLNTIITANFEDLANLAEINKDLAAWEDEDIEATMAKYDLTAAEAVDIMKAMNSARYNANARAMKAADAGAAAAIDALGGIELDENEHHKNPERAELYRVVWLQIHEATMKVEFKALAKVC